MSQHHAILLLGSNKGNQKKNIETALNLLQERGCTILNKSKFLMSQPVEFVSSNIFCNIATSINTLFSPVKLLENIKNIEIEMGRIHDSAYIGNYEDRIIDIDIVMFDNLVFESEKLIIPHSKHMFLREFSKVLIQDLVHNQKHNI